MDNMKKLPIESNSVIFHWALQAKTLYELLFVVPYTYRILVEPEPADYENCVTAFTDGSGFANHKMENVSLEQNNTFNEGLEYENLYTSTVISIWAVATCNRTTNFHFVSS